MELDLDDYAHEPQCDRCKCCGMSWVDCEQCAGDGVWGHDCGEDCCACLHPEENMACGTCEGEGGWWHCSCDDKGKHKPWPVPEPKGGG